MAEEKKPKIDLKARLGKNQVGTAATHSMPQAGGLPQGVPVPPPPMGSGQPQPFSGGSSIPPPPVPSSSTSVPGIPVAGGRSPFAPNSAPPSPFAPSSMSAGLRPQAPAQHTTIKVEIDDETLQVAQKKAGKKWSVLAILGVLVGAGIGYVWGGSAAGARGATLAVQGAKDLAGDIEKSQAKVKELNEKIASAIKDLKEHKFPEQFGSELGGLSIPFGADKLAGRNIGRFDPRTLQDLFKYTNDIEALNDRKDALKNLFSGQKVAIVDSLASAGSPKVGFAVLVQKSPAHGPVAIITRLGAKDAFPYKDAKWPDKFNILADGKPLEVERYTAGDVVSTEKKMVALPLEPDALAAIFPNDITLRIMSELAKTAGVMAGRSGGGGVDDEEVGVIKKGEQLLVSLRKIGQ